MPSRFSVDKEVGGTQPLIEGWDSVERWDSAALSGLEAWVKYLSFCKDNFD